MSMICVLLSTYNGEKYLEEQLFSLQKQEDVEIQILVRDDGSTDRTHEILNEWQKRGMLNWYAGSNLGYALSFMHLLQNAPDADFYAFCDQDDIWLPNKLKMAIKKLEMLSGGRRLYCSNLFIYRKGNKEGVKWQHEPKNDLYRCLVRGIAFGCTMVFDQDLLNVIKAHPLCISHPHDLWVFKTAMLLGAVYYDMDSYIFYRQHENNQVGAEIDFCDRLRRKIKSFRSLRNQHYREEGAKELLRCYSGILTNEQITVLRTLANYRCSLWRKVQFLFSSKYISESLEDTFWLKVRILIGCV